MDLKTYISRGILEEYVLGLLDEERSQQIIALCMKHDELRREVAEIEEALAQLAFAQPIVPPADLQEKIWATLENLNKEKNLNLNDLPLINEYTNTEKWLGLVKPFIPSTITDERVMHLLRATPKVLQMFVISKTDFEDETHDELLESFIILEGECECTVGDDVFRVSAGGYAAIPLHTPHTVKILSPYVMAVMQRVAV